MTKDVQYHKSCDKAERCNFKECKPAECEHYKYNMKRFSTRNEDIEVDMSDDQLVAVGADLVEAKDIINAADTVFASAKSKHKSDVDKQEEIITSCVEVMKSRTQTIVVEVEECRDHVAGTFTRSFTDDQGEEIILEERELSDSEKQQELDLIAEKANPDDGSDEPEGEDAEPKTVEQSVDEEDIEAAIAVITEYRMAKTVTLERGLKVSKERANKLLEVLEALGHVGPVKGKGEPREVLFELPEESEE